MRRSWLAPLWIWVEVLLCLVALDVALFRVGLLWRATPDFGNNLASVAWANLFDVARLLETRRPAPDTALTVGSSVVFAGVSGPAINRTLREAQVPATVVPVTAFGLSAADSAVMAAAALRLDPWLVVYGAAVRDFRKEAVTDTPATRVFYDSTFELPALPRTDTEARFDARVKRYWRLYRYRFFVRSVLKGFANQGLRRVSPSLVFAEPPASTLPPEALERFLPQRVTPESYAVWERWRSSRRFADYMDWLRASGGHVLDEYRRQTLANFGPEDNPQVPAIDWMLGHLAGQGVRTVLVYFPENPAFRDPDAAPYYDPSLSAAYEALFPRLAAAHGARFLDLRDLLPAEDFYDLIHPNLVGMRKISARLAALVEEEWQARGRGPG